MKIIITEKQYSLIKEQFPQEKMASVLGGLGTFGVFVSKNIDQMDKFANEIRPEIERKGMQLFPANDMVKKDPKLRSTPEYRELKDKEDAYDHQLASALATSMFGPTFADLIGKANEIKGGLRMFLRGSSKQNIGKFEKFTSGWDEDNANNEIGIELGTKYPNRDIEFYSQQVIKNINSKNYYDSTGKKKS